MKKAKSIRELYDEVRYGGYDCVLTNDAPLATALNAMMDFPHVGGFAFTPRQIAGMEMNRILRTRECSDLEVIRDISEETGISDLRFIYSEVQNIREIRRHSADVRKYLYTGRARRVYDAFAKIPTIDKVMETYDPKDAESFYMSRSKVAVIGLDMFDDLDKRFIPDPSKYDEIELFAEGIFDIPKIYAPGNDRQIADAAVDLITKDNAEDFAVVMDSGGRVADALRAALYRRRIPFKNTMDVRDLSQVRDYLQFLTLAMTYYTVRVRDVRELFSAYRTAGYGGLRPQWDGYLLSRISEESVSDAVTLKLMSVMRDARSMTFGEAAEKIMETRKRQGSQIRMLLEDLGVYGSPVDPRTLDYLVYAVDNVGDLKHNEQIPESERRGVLLADCKRSTYIDRQVIIFIGMDGTWDPGSEGEDYVDREAEDECNALRLSILLQQGDRRVYLARPVTNGRETGPSRLFETICAMEGKPRQISTFADICGDVERRSWHRDADSERKFPGSAGLGPASDDGWRFSKSSYNSYVDCPVSFLLGSLIRTEDSEYTVFGSCLHSFAEFYLCYPDIVKKRGIGRYIELVGEMYSGMSSKCMEEIDRSRFRIYMRNITRYIDAVRPDDLPLDTRVSDRKYPNEFMLREGLGMCSSWAEAEMGGDRPIFAKFDFVFGNTIVDYKTGRPKSARDIVNGFVRGSGNHCEFQPIIYLAVLQCNRRALPCEFDLLFVGDNDIESAGEGFDIMRNVRRVILDGRIAAEIMRDGEWAEALRVAKAYKPHWTDIIDALSEEIGKPGLSDNDENKKICLRIAGIKETDKSMDGARSLLDKVAKGAAGGIMAFGDSTVYITRTALDRFYEDLREDYEEASRIGSMPIFESKVGSLGCDKCVFRGACMKEKTDDGAETEE